MKRQNDPAADGMRAAEQDNREAMRYINVTLIDAIGAPTTTQLMTNRADDALEYLNNKVLQNVGNSLQEWDKPIVAAYVFDTHGQTLRSFRVIRIGGLTRIEEVL